MTAMTATTRPSEPKPTLAPGALAVLAIALLAGGYLRFRGLSSRGLWTDELVSWWAVSSSSLRELLGRCATCMATPPLGFVAERMSWLALGKSEWALRLPSALAGTATIAIVFLAGARMFGAWTGAIAAAVLAIHPAHIGFSTEARPYAIAGLLATLSVWSWCELLRSRQRAWIVLYVVATASLLYAQFVFLPLLAAQCVGALLAWRAGLAAGVRVRAAGFALGAALVLALPLAPQIAGIAGRASSLAWDSAEEYPPWIYAFFQTTPLLAAGLIALVVSRMRSAEPTWEGSPGRALEVLQLALAFIVPSILIGVLALARQLPSLAKARYGAAYLGVCALLVGWALTRPARAGVRRVLAGSFLTLVFVTQILPPLASGRTFNVDAEQEDWAGAARYVESQRRPGDVVLLRAVLVESAGLFDGTLRAGCASYLAAPLSDFYLTPGTQVAILPQNLPPRFASTPYGSLLGARAPRQPRFWIVLAGAPDPIGYVDSVLGWLKEATHREFRMEDPRAFGPVSVALLAPANGE